MKKLQLRPLSCGCVAHVPYCLNCGLETCPQDLYNGMYCPMCKDKICSGERMSYSAECAIPGCPNRTDQGDFRGDFCAPCFRYIVTGGGSRRNPSQAYLNELVKANLRALSAMRSGRDQE